MGCLEVEWSVHECITFYYIYEDEKMHGSVYDEYVHVGDVEVECMNRQCRHTV